VAKDPAVLWYWADWHSGTTTLSRFLKGCYMDLLHAQFNNGRLTISEIKTVLGVDFAQAWHTLQKKFKQDEAGLFYNERAEIEKAKREKFVKSRSNNLKSSHTKHHMESHMGNHMEPHMDNVDVNKDGVKDGLGVKGGKEGSDWDSEKQKFLQDGGWIYKFCMEKRLTPEQFTTIANEFLTDLELKEDYKPIKEIRSHFTNWYNKTKNNGKPGANWQTSTGGNSGNKPGTSEARIKRAKEW
jgi:hypothetical protein